MTTYTPIQQRVIEMKHDWCAIFNRCVNAYHAKNKEEYFLWRTSLQQYEQINEELFLTDKEYYQLYRHFSTWYPDSLDYSPDELWINLYDCDAEMQKLPSSVNW